MIKALIVDDEAQARSALRREIMEFCSNVDVVAEAQSVAEAKKILDSSPVDLIFLDIQLADGMGFDLFESTSDLTFRVIFTTAYSEYALKAIRYAALDYLLKPIDGEQLAEAVQRLSHIHPMELKEQVETYHHNQNNPDRQRVNFHTSDGIRLVNPDEVVRCSAESNYTMLYFANHTRLLVSKPLKEIESLLNAFGFERIHKSYLINIKHLVAYLNKDNGCVQLSDGTIWPVSQRKKSYVLQLLKSRRSDMFTGNSNKDRS